LQQPDFDATAKCLAAYLTEIGPRLVAHLLAVPVKKSKFVAFTWTWTFASIVASKDNLELVGRGDVSRVATLLCTLPLCPEVGLCARGWDKCHPYSIRRCHPGRQLHAGAVGAPFSLWHRFNGLHHDFLLKLFAREPYPHCGCTWHWCRQRNLSSGCATLHRPCQNTPLENICFSLQPHRVSILWGE
jgi:hypothetical protein